jgi:endonuclease/exonuclease/phosphatase (EEP) superfamily protein YafD
MTGLGGCAGLAAGLALLGGHLPVLDVLAHLAPLYLILGAIVAVWFLVAGRGPGLAFAVLAMIAAATLMAPEFRRPIGSTPAPDVHRIKVIQLNALRTNAGVGQIVDWLMAEDPDVVILVEARPDLRDRLRARTGWAVAGAASDLMIFTPQRYLNMDRPRPPPELTNHFVNATYDGPGGPFEVVAIRHGWPTSPDITSQRQGLEWVTQRLPRNRMILAGDFNAAPWSAGLRRMDRTLGLIRRDRAVATWPAQAAGRPWPLPFLPIDHVYAGPGWATVSVTRGPWLGSDHYPLVVELTPSRQDKGADP